MLHLLANLARKALGNVPLSSPAALEIFGAPATSSNLPIDATAVLKVPAFNAGVRLISEAIGSLDWGLYREAPAGREMVKAGDHPVAALLEQPNGWTGETEFKRQIVADYLIWGNGVSIVARVNGAPRELYRADPRVSNIVQDMTSGEPAYSIAMTEGGAQDYGWRDVIHLRNTSLDGIRGLGLVSLGQEAVALSLLLEAYASGLFARGARPGGVLEMPGKIGTEMLARLRKSFSQSYAGSENAGRTIILEQGAKFVAQQLSSVDAQFIELRKFQIQEAARLLNIAPTLLGDLENATLNNSAELRQQFLDMTLLPIIELFEDALELALLSEEDRAGGYCIEFDTSNFVRNDIEKRFAALKTGIECGVLTLNEARDREGLPPVDGGDMPMRSVQVAPLNSTGAAPAPAPMQEPLP
ncbi:MAG: phage portal protein [Methylocystis sp.]|uniref:phage portal protein n=1 Tax=Methylocystis sp. TaxID=1911079 RepID=UPI003DA32CE2